MKDSVDPEQEERLKAMYGIDSFLYDRSGYALEASVFEPTANIAGLLSGYTEAGVKTVLPAKAMAKMDFRLVPNQDPNDILKNSRPISKRRDLRISKSKSWGKQNLWSNPLTGSSCNASKRSARISPRKAPRSRHLSVELFRCSVP
jgi:acetylornithine deacetylase/succinyl-diaminopimelate desuccinylase-like protein